MPHDARSVSYEQTAVGTSARGSGMGEANLSVLVIDDDRSFVTRLCVSCERSPGEPAILIGLDPPDGPTCLALDVRLPALSGP